MDNKLLTYTGIIAIVMLLPTYLGMAGWGGTVFCLISLVLTFVLYKKYTDDAADKTQNTIGQGVKFGVVAGVMMTLLSLIHTYTLFDPEVARQIAIEGIEPMADFLGEEGFEAAVNEIEKQSDEDLISNQRNYSFAMIFGGAIIGLIAGLIFKHREDEV